MLHSICQQIWKTQHWPQDWKRSVLIPVPKKGSTKECANHRTIAPRARAPPPPPAPCLQARAACAPPSPAALRFPVPIAPAPAWGPRPSCSLLGADRSWALPGHRVLDGHERAAGPIPQLHPPAPAGRGPRLPLQLWPVSLRPEGHTRDHTCRWKWRAPRRPGCRAQLG